MVIATPNLLEKFQSVFLHKHDRTGPYSTPRWIHPGEMVRQFSSPTKFQLIPLTASGEVAWPENGFEARGKFWEELKRWKHVAIRCETKGAFLSCRRKTHIPGLGDSALVEYRRTIGSSERFELHHFPDTESFSFRSHNGLYLSNNKALGSIVFRSESSRDGATIASHRAWELTPIMNFSSTDERVKFLGVIDNSRRVVMKLQPTEEEGQEQDEHEHEYMRHAARTVLEDIQAEGLRRGECTHFHTPNGDCHYYARDKHGVVSMVVVSKGFSRALAGECVNDLGAIYKKFAKGHTKTGLANQGTQTNEKKIQNELRFLVWNYNEHNETFRHHPLRKMICDQMEDAIDRVLDYKGNKITLGERVEALNGTAERFRNTMRRLRKKRVSKWIVAGAVWGGVVGGTGGGMVGMVLGGPTVAALLGAQGAKVGAFVAGSGASIGVARCNTPRMWKNYVPSSNYGI